MSIVTDSTLRAMLEQLHAALSDDDGKGARVWAALTVDNFAEVQVGDFFNHSRYRFAVLYKTAYKIVGVGIYPSGDGREISRFEYNLVNGALQDPVITKLASLADLEDLKRGEYTSLTADNFADVKVGDKVINGVCIYKTSVACVVYTGYQKLIQYEISNGVVTPYEMTVPEKGEVAALKTAVNGKWDKPVVYGEATPITPENFHSVKPGDYLYGTMCVRGSNGGTELQFSGSGTYRKVHLKEASLEDKLMGVDKVVEHEYGVLATTAQLNALKTEVANLKPVVYEYKSTWKEADFAKIKIGDIVRISNTNHTVETNSYVVTDIWSDGFSVGFEAVGSPRHFINAYWDTSKKNAVINYYTGIWNWTNPTGEQWNDINIGDTITYGGQIVTVIYKSSSEIRAFNGLQVYVFPYQTGSAKLTPTVKTIQFA